MNDFKEGSGSSNSTFLIFLQSICDFAEPTKKEKAGTAQKKKEPPVISPQVIAGGDLL